MISFCHLLVAIRRLPNLISARRGSTAPHQNTETRGAINLLLLMITLSMGVMLLQGTSQLLAQGAAAGRDERDYYRAWFAAQSALHWGLQHSWPQSPGWYCHPATPQNFSSCLWQSRAGEGWLRGAALHKPVVVWRRVALRPAASAQYQLQAQAQGWIDSCPLAKTADCAPPTRDTIN